MRHAIKLLLTISMVGTIIVGCSKSSNPITPSDTQTSGTLQYTFAMPRTTYNPADTLLASVTVHNSGSASDTIAVGDGIFEWMLVNSSGDTVMIGGGDNNAVVMLAILPGQSKLIYSIDWVLAYPAGSYSLKATVRPMSFVLNLSVQ